MRGVNTFGGERPAGPSPKDVAWLLIGVAGLAFCLTLVFLGMRAVMDIGGYCADGGPYVSRQSCPDGVPLAMVGGIFGLFLFGAILAVGGSRVGARYGGLVFLAWPALFLSLGWNFLEYGFKPPGGGGPEFGWLLCGVVFVIMGGGPLLGLLPMRGVARRDPVAMRRLVNDLQARQRQLATRERATGAASTWTSSAPAERMDLTSRLERLATLHTVGKLTDAEFDEAKRRVIAEVAAGR
jgi:hypothetical protein